MKKNLVVIGYGGIGAGFHVKNALTSDVVNLVGVYDIDEAKCELARSRGIKTYDSLDAVLKDPQVDMVTVATSNDVHCDITLQALRAGKHVLCEKPVAMNLSELELMIRTAEEMGLIFSVHQNRRFDVDYLAMKEIYESGKIGEVFDLESRIHGSRGIPSDWRCLKEHGGGMMLDWGVHLIDQVLQIIQKPIRKVYCEFDYVTTSEVDDGFKLHLTFEGGCRATVEVGTCNFIAMPRFYMRGKKGSALINSWKEPAKVVECTHWSESDVLPIQTAAGLTKTMAPRDSITTNCYNWTRPQSDVHDYYRNFVKAIDGKAEILVTHPQMLRLMRVIEAAFKSGEQNCVIDFNE